MNSYEDLKPPTYTDARGKVHVGCLLSVMEYASYADQLDRMESMSVAEQIELASALLHAFFPVRQPWMKWRKSVAADILERPDLWTLLADFLACQLRAMKVPTRS